MLREPEHNRAAQVADAGGCVRPGLFVFDSAGQIADAALREQLRKFLAGFVRFAASEREPSIAPQP